MTIFSLNPIPPGSLASITGEAVPPASPEDLISSFLIRHRSPIDSDSDRRKVIGALRESMAQSDEKSMRCFKPRHAITVMVEQKRVEIVLCFECRWMHVHGIGDEMLRLKISEAGKDALDSVLEANSSS